MILSIILLLIVVISFVFYLKVKNDIKNFLNKGFGTSNLKEILNNEEYEIQETPKTLFGMESIYLSTISNDFPDFNINELNAIYEDYIINALNVI